MMNIRTFPACINPLDAPIFDLRCSGTRSMDENQQKAAKMMVLQTKLLRQTLQRQWRHQRLFRSGSKSLGHAQR